MFIVIAEFVHILSIWEENTVLVISEILKEQDTA